MSRFEASESSARKRVCCISITVALAKHPSYFAPLAMTSRLLCELGPNAKLTAVLLYRPLHQW